MPFCTVNFGICDQSPKWDNIPGPVLLIKYYFHIISKSVNTNGDAWKSVPDPFLMVTHTERQRQCYRCCFHWNTLFHLGVEGSIPKCHSVFQWWHCRWRSVCLRPRASPLTCIGWRCRCRWWPVWVRLNSVLLQSVDAKSSYIQSYHTPWITCKSNSFTVTLC